MSSRLQLKYGLVAEHDRLSNSADACSSPNPLPAPRHAPRATSTYRVSARARRAQPRCGRPGRRHHPARVLLRRVGGHPDRAREVDPQRQPEAAPLARGQPACRRAPRPRRRGRARLRAVCGHCRRRGGLLGPCRAIAHARARAGPGLPADDTARIDVWRGDFSVGDSLLLCSKNLVDVVGTEEIKNAVVTLHPQSAVEHLHHLFVAAGGEGSDAVLALEATEVALSRVEHKLMPVSPSEPLAGAPSARPSPWPTSSPVLRPPSRIARLPRGVSCATAWRALWMPFST